MTSTADFLGELRRRVGECGKPSAAPDDVNRAMIRHWTDAMTDRNPVYTDSDAAARSVHGEIVAPPTMLNVWNMIGNVPREPDPSEPHATVLTELDRAGFTSVVATDADHEYLRYLRPGEVLSATHRLTDVSEEKRTALGVGYFVTWATEFANQSGEAVGRMEFRVLKFRPGTGRSGLPEGPPSAVRGAVRPRPGISRDTQFFWDGVQAGELRIQQCSACESLYHPPMVRCPKCASYDFGYRTSSGRATVYSFVEPCHPRVPGFEYPYVVGLVELEEGTRLITNLVDIDPDLVEVGMPVQLDIRRTDPELALPMFRPVRPARLEGTRAFGDTEIGGRLAPCPIAVTPTLIVAGAMASRDFEDVHHDRDRAIERGSPDIFMNILTTSGLCGRYVGDWAGTDALIRRLKIRLGAPNYPGDAMTLYGTTVARRPGAGGGGSVDIALRGANRLGDHVTGTCTVELPGKGGGR